MVRGPSRLATVILATALAGCSPAGPEPGAEWEIAAVDRSGELGSIAIELGDVVPLPANARIFPEQTRAILVRVTYDLDRPSDIGYGWVDWGAVVGDEDLGVDGAAFRIVRLPGDVEWPVGPALGQMLPGGVEPLDGWIAVAVSEADLNQRISLQYQPYLDVEGAQSRAVVVTDVVIHDP